MKKSIHILLAAVLAASAVVSGCAGKSRAKGEGDKPLVVAMELTYPPFETKDEKGNPTGVSVDFMKAFGESIGREVRIENTAWDGLIPSLQTGKADMVMSSMTITEERAKTVDFSDAYANAMLAVLTNKDSGITSVEDLNQPGMKVAVKTGSTGYIYAEYIRITGDVGTPSAPAEPTPAPSNPEAEQTAKTTEYVNFRTGPGTNYSSKGVISLGTTVTVTDTSNSQWYAVRLANGSTGYIFAQYIKITSTPSATATPAPTPTPAPSDPSKEQTAKTTEYVNFRTGPGTNYSSKGVIPSGTAITVTDTSNSQWYAVRLADGSTGYIFAQYIKITSATAMPAPTEAPADGTVRAKTTADVNLRKGAGTNYGVIRVVGNNTAVTVTEATNTWYKVKLSDGTEGYLYAQYVTVTSGDINSVKKEETTDPSTLTEAEQKAKSVLDTIGWDLRAAYNWSAHALPYYTLGPEVTGNSVHSEWYANFGFDNHKGNCYVMAATFQKMAKLLGYDAHLVEGYIRTYNGRGRHGWVEIDMNGTTYVFDPNFEYGGYGNGYQINYGMSGTFKYIDYARVD